MKRPDWLQSGRGRVKLSRNAFLWATTLDPGCGAIACSRSSFTGDAGEAQEIYYAKFRLEEEGWQVHIATPEKTVFLSVVHDFEPGFDTYTEKPGYRVQADLGLDEVEPDAYDGLVLPGGRAPEYLRNRPEGRRDRPPFPGDGQADRRQLPRPAAC